MASDPDISVPADQPEQGDAAAQHRGGGREYAGARHARSGPLRARVQAVIDRRFFRKKYDARLVLEQFAQRAQRESELETISADLLATVQEMLEPEDARLWLIRRS